MQTRKGGFELEDLVVRAANMISDLAQVCCLPVLPAATQFSPVLSSISCAAFAATETSFATEADCVSGDSQQQTLRKRHTVWTY